MMLRILYFRAVFNTLCPIRKYSTVRIVSMSDVDVWKDERKDRKQRGVRDMREDTGMLV